MSKTNFSISIANGTWRLDGQTVFGREPFKRWFEFWISGVYLTFSYMYTVTTRLTWREGRDSYNEVASEI